MTSPLDLFYAGRLPEAIAASTEKVRQRPTDTGARGALCDFLCFAGELERADRQLEALAHQETTAAVGVAVYRQLIRAEQARQQFYTDGRLPDFLEPPSDRLRLHLEASVRIREGLGEEAARLLDQAEAQRPRLKGTCDGRPFEGLCDVDDLTASFFEVLAASGKYYWVPMESVELIELHPHQRPRDLLWRRARLVVRGGPDGEVYFPALYAGAHAEKDGRLQLGQATEWRGGGGPPVRGVGQRILLVGEEERPIMEIEKLTFQPPGA